MAITDFVVVTVTVATRAISRAGFGTLAFVNNNTVQTAGDRVQFYVPTDLPAIITAGFALTDQFYLWAVTVASQAVVPTRIATIWKDGVEAFDAAIVLAVVESDDFYFVNADTRLEADINLIATDTQARRKVYFAQTSDAALLAGTAGNIGEDLRLASLDRTSLWYHSDDTEFLDGAISGIGAAANLDAPGGRIVYHSITGLSGVAIDDITVSEQAALLVENANRYQLEGDIGVTYPGKGSTGEFFDVKTTEDWFFFRTREKAFGAQISTDGTPVPYDQSGIGTFENVAREMGELGQRNGHLSVDVAPDIIAPLIEDVDTVDKQNRLLNPPVQLIGTLAGAILKSQIQVNLVP